MAQLTSREQAQLEHALAQAHRVIWRLADFYYAADRYETGDDLHSMAQVLADLMEAELKKGRSLRSRPRNRA